MDETDAFPHVAAAVAESAVRLGLARVKRTRAEFLERARARMERPRRLARELVRRGLVAPLPDEPSRPRRGAR